MTRKSQSVMKRVMISSKLRLTPDTFADNSLMYFCFQLLKVAAKKIKVLLPEKNMSQHCMHGTVHLKAEGFIVFVLPF